MRDYIFFAGDWNDSVGQVSFSIKGMRNGTYLFLKGNVNNTS